MTSSLQISECLPQLDEADRDWLNTRKKTSTSAWNNGKIHTSSTAELPLHLTRAPSPPAVFGIGSNRMISDAILRQPPISVSACVCNTRQETYISAWNNGKIHTLDSRKGRDLNLILNVWVERVRCFRPVVPELRLRWWYPVWEGRTK